MKRRSGNRHLPAKLAEGGTPEGPNQKPVQYNDSGLLGPTHVRPGTNGERWERQATPPRPPKPFREGESWNTPENPNALDAPSRTEGDEGCGAGAAGA